MCLKICHLSLNFDVQKYYTKVMLFKIEVLWFSIMLVSLKLKSLFLLLVFKLWRTKGETVNICVSVIYDNLRYDTRKLCGAIQFSIPNRIKFKVLSNLHKEHAKGTTCNSLICVFIKLCTQKFITKILICSDRSLIHAYRCTI